MTVYGIFSTARTNHYSTVDQDGCSALRRSRSIGRGTVASANEALRALSQQGGRKACANCAKHLRLAVFNEAERWSRAIESSMTAEQIQARVAELVAEWNTTHTLSRTLTDQAVSEARWGELAASKRNHDRAAELKAKSSRMLAAAKQLEPSHWL
jgi:hypothetical protein